MKFCRKCHTEKPDSEFYFDKRRQALSAPCKTCRSGNQNYKFWRARNPEKVKASDRRTKLKLSYGLSPETLTELWLSQDKSCKICRKPISISATEKASKPHVDHDHVTGAVRGLLCLTCNTGLGMFGDSVDLLDAAKHYLLRARGDHTLKLPDTASVSAGDVSVH